MNVMFKATRLVMGRHIVEAEWYTDTLAEAQKKAAAYRRLGCQTAIYTMDDQFKYVRVE